MSLHQRMPMQNDTRHIRLSDSRQESHILGNISLFWCENKVKLSGEVENNAVREEDNLSDEEAGRRSDLVTDRHSRITVYLWPFSHY